MPAAVLAAQQDSDPVPGLVLLALLLCGGGWWLWRRRQRKRAVAAALAAGLEPIPVPSLRERLKRAPRRLWTPAIVLAFLAPFCLEGFAGASPPWIFFNPIVLVYFMLFYGSAAILIREITRRWGKSWPTILALGAAYAICEEGLSTKVFFDLHRTNLGPQMQYGTWAGVHWPYMFHLITAHAVFSIAVPIFLTMLLFPQRASEPWVRRRTLPVLGAVFVGGIVFSSLVLYRRNPDRPHHVIQVTPPHYLIAIGVVLLLIAVARLLPAQIALPGRRITLPPKRLAIVGFSGMFVFWGVSYLFPAWDVPVAITMILEVLIVAIAAWFALRLSADQYSWFALVGGMLSFFVFTSFILMAIGSFLQPVVSVTAGYLLLRLGRSLRERTVPDDPVVSPTGGHE